MVSLSASALCQSISLILVSMPLMCVSQVLMELGQHLLLLAAAATAVPNVKKQTTITAFFK